VLVHSIDRGILRQLGQGTELGEITAELGISRDAWDHLWLAELQRRVPSYDGERRVPRSKGGVRPAGAVVILRDGRGFPHVRAASDSDLFFGYGYAMAQDRLFQMDLRRRRGQGRLAEVLGGEGLEADRVARTIGLHLAARTEAERLDTETHGLLDAFAGGVNAHLAELGELVPIEFDLLDYRPEPWTVESATACAMSWRWQLSGRPWVVAAPELVKRKLGDGTLYRRFLDAQREADDVSTVPPGSYAGHRVGADPIPPTPAWAAATVDRGRSPLRGNRHVAAEGPPGAELVGAAGEGGSNDWVVAGSRTRSGKPLVASDPHMPYEAASSLYEVHLQGGSFDVAGAGWVGMPGVTIGRNRTIAWGITNNICSLRDLYAEGEAEVGELRDETIEVRGADPVRLPVRATRHGPIVDELLPAVAAGTGPVSMRWAGLLPCDWTAAQLRIDRAGTVAGAMEAARGWRVPSFSLVLGDLDGRIGYLATGAVPIREVVERGYRPGDDPAHEWAGSIPRDGMPQIVDPPAGYLVTANNRPAPDDFPYPLSGTWDEGMRARRIGALIEAATPADVPAMGRIQNDLAVQRSAATVPALVDALTRLSIEHLIGPADRRDDLEGGAARPEEARAARDALLAWDGTAAPYSRGAAIYEVLFTRWMQAVARERLGADVGGFVWPWTGGLAGSLLAGDDGAGWSGSRRRRDELLHEVAMAAIVELTALLGPDVGEWRWGRLHRLGLHHPLASRGSLGELLHKPLVEVGGDPWSINNSGYVGGGGARQADPRAFEAASGAGYRMVVDLGESPPRAWTVTAESQSAHPGSAHWTDQLEDFVSGRYHPVPLDPSEVDASAVARLVLLPHGDEGPAEFEASAGNGAAARGESPPGDEEIAR